MPKEIILNKTRGELFLRVLGSSLEIKRDNRERVFNDSRVCIRKATSGVRKNG